MSTVDSVIDMSVALGKGVYSVGEDIVLGVQRTGQGLGLGADGRMSDIGYENRAAVDVISNFIKYPIDHPDNPLYHLIITVLEDYYEKFPDEAVEHLKKEIGVGVGYMVGRMVVGRKLAVAVAARIAATIAATAGYREITKRIGLGIGVGKTGVGLPVGMLMMQGVLQRSSSAAKRLEIRNPNLFRKLQKTDLQILYFLVEKPLADYIDAIDMATRDPAGFQKAIMQKYGLGK